MKAKNSGKNRVTEHQGVIGIDEVGRGPLAGPVTVCAIYLENPKQIKKEIFSINKKTTSKVRYIIRDSKKLTKINRNKIFQTIKKYRLSNDKIKYAIFSSSARKIDKVGITHAIKVCLARCVKKLEAKGVDISSIKINLDAGLIIPILGLNQKSFVRGDEKFAEIALASIIAKETRDSYMRNLAKNYKEYDWINNVGYGTRNHLKAIKKYGVTKYHRRTFLKNILR